MTEGSSSSENDVEDLDFFILLSSVSGVIGNSAQGNYCAGNTFEDVLAHHRRANGMAAMLKDWTRRRVWDLMGSIL
ncbi:hypothetical protein K4K51_007770 [Colletotrichum sp. SAR 10_75]|nr:hypothetical protein K4K51_007770 [Colletotrichum sp. SAR 10_75]